MTIDTETFLNDVAKGWVAEYDFIYTLSNLCGPAVSAKMCDAAMKSERKLFMFFELVKELFDVCEYAMIYNHSTDEYCDECGGRHFITIRPKCVRYEFMKACKLDQNYIEYILNKRITPTGRLSPFCEIEKNCLNAIMDKYISLLRSQIEILEECFSKKSDYVISLKEFQKSLISLKGLIPA